MIPRPDLIALPPDEKLQIIEQLWESLTTSKKNALPVPDWHRAELESRQRDIDQNPGNTVPWQTIKRQLNEK